ncbi:hypothetical protein NLI96_g7705 [Meripilus lineatus]|uniref:Uncharacterized protein n=1 Tax=Meripilus lineatus TaxID=2056292 RepID=A0AAD5YEN4_9APHY|nr:hypothetical protein NLI96_g7705 [Physisporinus lineatus]
MFSSPLLRVAASPRKLHDFGDIDSSYPKRFQGVLFETDLGSSPLHSRLQRSCALDASVQPWTPFVLPQGDLPVQQCPGIPQAFPLSLELQYVARTHVHKSNRHMLSYWSPTSTSLMTGVPTSCG